MVNIGTLKTIVGFGLKGLGLFWTFFDKFLCGSLCESGCSLIQTKVCSFLFLFVGIILIICGYALIIMKQGKRKKLKTKIKDLLKDLKK